LVAREDCSPDRDHGFAFDLDGWLATKLGTRIARITNTHFTTGDGASKPGGVVTGATLGYTAGNSTSSGETASITYDDLIELEHSVDPAYRKKARYMMSDAALKVIKKVKDGIGRPLWVAGLDVGAPDTINAFPYTINQDMAAPAASAKSVLFGDFSNYFIRRVAGIQVLRPDRALRRFQPGGLPRLPALGRPAGRRGNASDSVLATKRDLSAGRVSSVVTPSASTKIRAPGWECGGPAEQTRPRER
jgi:hypothetical protein